MKGPPRRSRAAQLARLAWDFARSIPLASRFRHGFATIREVCLFVGAPKTGHSLVGALLDAHPRIVIAHEVDVLLLLRLGFRRDQIFALLLDNARRQAERGRGESGYDYVVPGQWQGRFERLAVLGDKHAEGTALRLLLYPRLWRRLERELGRPRFVHVVRNPFDIVASLTRPAKRELDLQAAIAYCFSLLSILPEVRRRAGDEHYVELRHEELVASPRESVARLCGFLGEEAPADYLEACAARVFTAPRRARDGVEWTPPQIRDIEEHAARFDFLRGYDFVR